MKNKNKNKVIIFSTPSAERKKETDYDKMIEALQEELYGYKIYPGLGMVRIEKTTFKSRMVEAPMYESFPLPEIRRYMFTAALSWEELEGLYSSGNLGGLRDMYERSIQGYMEGD